MHTARCIIFVLILVLLALVSPSPSFAASSGGLSVSPAFVDISLPEASSEAEIAITYKNNSTKHLTLELFPIDFRQTGPFGQIGFIGKKADEYSYSLSSFLSFGTNRLDLAAGEKKTVSLLARNRKDLTPGGHYASVVARMVPEEGDETTVAPAVSTLIYLRKIGGERFHLSLKEVSWPKSIVVFSLPTTMTLEFQNEGNVHLIPYGELVVKDMFGRKVMDGVVNEGSLRILPESLRYVPVYVKKTSTMLPFSVNFLTVKGKDSLGKVTYNYSDTYIYIHPVMGVVPIVLLGVWVVLKKRRRRS